MFHLRPIFPWFRVVSVAMAGGALVLYLRRPTPPSPPDAVEVPPVWATDVEAEGTAPLRIGEKARPFEGQKKPPCAKRLEVEHAGACWIPHEARPPCPAGSFEGAGRCLVPVKSAQRPPTSLGATP